MRRLAVLLALAPLAAGCADGDGAVEIGFRPAEGDELDYVTAVESETTTDLPCQPLERRTDRTTLATTQRVLEVGDDGVDRRR